MNINGIKTYVVGTCAIITGLYLYTEGKTEQAYELVLFGLGIMGIRHGMPKKN